jgi:heme/copper-type cytochrome/quinol oxidase subunit 2
MTRWIVVSIAALCLLLVFPSMGAACPSCYGKADSPMIDGMNTAIVAMIGVTAVVLLGIVAFSVFMWRRRRKLYEPGSTSVNEQGVMQWNTY